MSGRLEQVYLPSDSRLDLPGEGPLFELDFNTWWDGGNVWLNIVIKFVKIPYLLTSKKVEGSLSKLLCIS